MSRKSRDWPSDAHISNVAINGECDAPVYKMPSGDLCGINPVGSYALYKHGNEWRESARYTNSAVRASGVLVNPLVGADKA